MPKFEFLIPVLTLLTVSCTKTGNNGTNPPGNGSGKVTVTSISADNFYPDENITITGTGFDPDKTKDIIEIGVMDDASDDDTTQVFHSYYVDGDAYFSIVSATSTQLVVKAVSPDSLIEKLLRTQLYYSFARGVFQITVSGSSAITSSFKIKNIPDVSAGLDLNTYHPMYPGDSVLLRLGGIFNNSICDMSVYFSGSKLAGCDFIDPYMNSNIYYVPTPCPCEDFSVLVYGCGQGGGNNFSKGRLVSYDSVNNSAVIIGIIPENFFNTTYGAGTWGPVINIKLKAVNSVGKTSKVVTFPIATVPSH
jgi:hypothetical protein